MKIEKSNNPAGVGMLILVLILIVGRIIVMLFGHGGSVAAASTVSAAVPSPNSSPTAVTRTPPAATAVTPDAGEAPPPAAAPATARNPFATRAAFATTHAGALAHPDASRRTVSDVGPAPLTALPPLPVHAVGPGRETSVRPLPSAHGLSGPPSHQTPAPGAAAAMPTLRLTAVVGGSEAMAVVQTTNPAPVILHVGDFLDGMRVVAIHDDDVTFARGSGFWTLPLQSAADGSAVSTASVDSVPAPPGPVLSVAVPEEKTDDSQ